MWPFRARMAGTTRGRFRRSRGRGMILWLLIWICLANTQTGLFIIFLRIWKHSSKAGGLGLLLLLGSLASSCRLLAQSPDQKNVPGNSIPSVSDEWPTFNGDFSGRRYS